MTVMIIATTEDNNFFGKMSTMEPSKKRLVKPLLVAESDTIYYRDVVASGLAAVWAQDNTRESLFDAMARKETYASTGPSSGPQILDSAISAHRCVTQPSWLRFHSTPDLVSVGQGIGAAALNYKTQSS